MVRRKAKKLVQLLTGLGKSVAVAESCTAGLVSSLIAGVPGASRVLWGSFVTYTLEAKQKMLGVPNETLEHFGAVSRECACAMALGALEKSGADFALSVTGLAGPGGDGTELPVGTVWIAAIGQGEKAQALLYHFRGSRNHIRKKAAEKVIDAVLNKIQGK
jgi:PncC family amidohydrolase